MSKAQDIIALAESVPGLMDEVKKITVYRHGQKVVKLACPDGYKADGNKCVKMSSKETMSRHRAGIKAARKSRGKLAHAMAQRNKTIAKRNAAGF